MLPQTAELKEGGIDFNADKLSLEIKNDNGQIKFNMDPAILQELRNMPGFTPVIMDIRPLEDLK